MCGGGGKGRERRGVQGGVRAANPILPNVQLLLCFSQMMLMQCSIIQKKSYLQRVVECNG